MAVWSAVRLSAMGRGLRLDPEFYQPYLLEYDRLIGNARFPVRPLGELVCNGYRVVYENTVILEADEVVQARNAVRFLQANDIHSSLPVIDDVGMGWVSRNDWDRYEKGRVIPGELLIEVKGLARKVAIVPDEFPLETLVSGSVFKLQTRSNLLDPYFLLAYLLSRFGVGFRFRCLTNTLIGFVNKEELYAIPVVVPPLADQVPVATLVRQALNSWHRASEEIAGAEVKLMEALGLDHLDLTSQKCYTRHFHELDAGNRFGAEYYMPCKKRVIDTLAAMPHHTIADHAPGIRETWDPKQSPGSEKVRNYDVTDALDPFLDDTEPQVAAEIGSTKKRFQAGDVVISRLRSYLKEIAVARASSTLPTVGSSEFIVLRPTGDGLSAETLMVFLRCPLVQTILKWSQDGSNHPRFAEEDLLAIPVPDALLRVQKKIDPLVKEAIDARRESERLLNQAKKTVEDMITGTPNGRSR